MYTMLHPSKIVLLLIIILINFSLLAAGDNTADSTTIIPGKSYEAGSLHRWFLGDGYRDVWTAPVKVPVLNLESFMGSGLKPLKRGGGLQTNSLRFEGIDGRVFVFRTVDKFPGRALPPDLKGTIIEMLGKDQIGLMLPFGGLIVSELSKELGLLHSPPFYCVMPDDPKLGEFRKDFAGMLGSIEERPDEKPDDKPGFGGSAKIVNSRKFSEKLDSGPDERIDAEYYLKARMLDILVSDWDRHADQWRWAGYEENGQRVWRPIARDRDFSFVIYDGIVPVILDQQWANRDIESFDLAAPDMISLEHKSRFMDVRLLNTLSWKDWQKIVSSFRQKVTDEVIENSVRDLPVEVFDAAGKEIIEKLKLRRDLLDKTAREYYEVVSEYVDIQTTNKAEYVKIERLKDGGVNLLITRKKDRSHKILERTFLAEETEELRLYLLGGKDHVEVSGADEGGIKVRIIGGKGDDVLIEKDEADDIYFYDKKKGADLSQAKNAKIRLDKKKIAYDRPPVGYAESRLTRSLQGEKLRPPYDYGYTSLPLPYFGFDVDNGFYIGGGIERTFYRFRADPYASKIILFGDYSFGTGAFYLNYEGDYRALIPKAVLNVKIKSALSGDKPNFFGYGNISEKNDELADEDYYKASIDVTNAETNLAFNLMQDFDLIIGTEYQFYRTHMDDKTFIADSNQAVNFDAGIENTLGLQLGLIFDSRDNITAPHNGFYVWGGLKYFPELFDNKEAFTEYSFLSKAFYSPFSRMTFAGRIEAEKLNGKFPYYRAAFIGGGHSLRGLNKNRYAGDTAVSGSAEIRFILTRQRVVFPSDIGLFIYSDIGRVWVEEESPGDWHNSFGAGISFAPLLRDFTIRASAAKSKDDLQIYWDLGYAF